MYFAYGWPKVFSADNSGEEFFYVAYENNLIVAVSRLTIEIWSGGPHRVRLGCCTRSAEAVVEDGANLQAFWSSHKNILAVLDAILPVPTTGGPLLHKVDVYLQAAILVDSIAQGIALTGDKKVVVVGLDDGTLASYSWLGKFRERCDPLDSVLDSDEHLGINSGSNLATISELGEQPVHQAIAAVDYCETGKLLALVLQDGSCAICQVPETGLCALEGVELSHWVCGPERHALCAHIGVSAQLVAVGCADGEVALYRLQAGGLASGPSGNHQPLGMASRTSSVSGSQPGLGTGPAATSTAAPVRVLSLEDWGYKAAHTGPVSQVRWTPDCRAVAVGYLSQGLALWSPSGCRLMCSLRQSGGLMLPRIPGTPEPRAPGTSSVEESRMTLEGGVGGLAWGPMGYQLIVAEVQCGASRRAALLELQFAHTLPNNHRVAHATELVGTWRQLQQQDEEVHILQAHDRLLLISQAPDAVRLRAMLRDEDSAEDAVGSDLMAQHLQLPSSYIAANWPVQHTAMSSSGSHIAVAGRRGLALYSRQSDRWRLFGDVSQERQVCCLGLCWLDSIVVVVSAAVPPQEAAMGLRASTSAADTSGCSLLLFPRYHLDFSSLLARHPLQQAPVAIDCVNTHILIASDPLNILILDVSLAGELTPMGSPVATLNMVCELSIMNAGLPLLDIALVPAAGPKPAAGAAWRPGAQHAPCPRHCVLLRWGGLMSVLDLGEGSEMPLAAEVECFWLSDTRTQGLQFSSRKSSGHELQRQNGSAELHTSTDGPSAGGSGEGGVLDPRIASQMLGRQGVTDSFLTASTSGGHVEVEMPWWAYGPKGMQLWFPSLLSQPLSPKNSGGVIPAPLASTDIELEFDREVYPVGISWADAAIVGVMQRIVRGVGNTLASMAMAVSGAPGSSLPCFLPMPESQPVLPCLLRRLLQKGAAKEALELASRHQRGPHFARSLEWLLFTALELESAAKRNAKRAGHTGYRAMNDGYQLGRAPLGDSLLNRQSSVSGRPSTMLPSYISPLLQTAAELIRKFPQFADVVVNVARKTDAALWPALFTAVGLPSLLLEGLLEGGALKSAACFLLVIDRLEGASVAHSLALRLLRAALQRTQHHLAAELLRFIIPPGELEELIGAPPRMGSRRSSVVEPTATHSRRTSEERIPSAASANGSMEQLPDIAEHQEQPTSSDGGGYASWLLGLFRRTPEPSALQQAAAPDQPEPAPAAVPVTRTASRSSSTLQAASRSSKQSAWEESVDSMTPGVRACQMVGEHAWQLLEGGHLAAAAQLAQAMNFINGGLALLMTQCSTRPDWAMAGMDAPVTAADLAEAMSVAVSELPVWDSPSCHADAERVLEVACSVRHSRWALALALLLLEPRVVRPFAAQNPTVWRQFVDLVHADDSLAYLREALDSLASQVGRPAPSISEISVAE